MGEYTTDWFGWQQAETEAALAAYRGLPNVRMLEIGAYEGRSTRWFLEHLLTGIGSHLTTIDTWQGSAEHDPAAMHAVYDRFRRNTLEFVQSGRLTVIVGRSQPFLAAGVAARLHPSPAFGYDIIYVDGSHHAADVLSDAVLSWVLLKPLGTMVFDDYLWDGAPAEHERPRLAIDAFLACHEGQFRCTQRGYQLAILKLPQP